MRVVLFCPELEQALFSKGVESASLPLFLQKASRCSPGKELRGEYRLLDYAGLNVSGESIAVVDSFLLDEEKRNGYWFARIDPVTVTPNRDFLMLVGKSHLDLSPAEADTIVSGLNAFFKDDGLQFFNMDDARWLVRSNRKFEIKTTPFENAVGQDVKTVLPSGADSQYWQKLVNEIQMWLHSCEVNQSRQARDERPVNSVWLWGEGVNTISSGKSGLLYAGDECSFLHALSLRAGGHFVSLTESAMEAMDTFNGESIIVQLETETFQGAHFFESLLKQSMQWLKTGKVSEVVLDTDRRCFTLKRHDLMRFWRKKQPLNRYFE